MRRLRVLSRARDPVQDVAPIFAQMNGDGIGPGLLCLQRGLNRIRIASPTGLAQGCHMVDVDPQKQIIRRIHYSVSTGIE